MNQPQKFAAPVLSSLTFRETVDLLRALNGGSAGFDYGKYRLDGLRAIVAAWQSQGCFSADTLTAHIANIIANRAPPPSATPPVIIPPFAPVAPSPVATVAPVAPAPVDSIPVFGAAPAPASTLANIVADVSINQMLQSSAPVAPPLHVPIFGVPDPVAPAPVAAPVEIGTWHTFNANAAPPIPSAPVEAGDIAIDPAKPFPQRVTARTLFSDQPAVAAALPASLRVNVYGSPDAPKVKSEYRFTPATVAAFIIAATCTPTQRVWCHGARGTGKTVFVEQMAARLGRAFFRVNFNRGTESADVLGDIGLVNGATEFQPGPVAVGVVTPGAIICLDEFSYCSAGNAASLNSVIERNGPPVRLPRTDQRLVIADDVMIVACDNTTGNGDESGAGEYHARSPISSDTMDRFQIFLGFEYMPADEEAKILRSMVFDACGVRMKVAGSQAIVRICAFTRGEADKGELMGAPSLRRSAAFATMVAMGIDPVVAWSQCIVAPAPASSHIKLGGIFAGHWPADFSQTNFFQS